MSSSQIFLSVAIILIGLAISAYSQTDVNKIVVHAKSGKDTINSHVYGHFAEHLGRCIYDGIWVGDDTTIQNIDGYRTDVVEALHELEIPVLRWPGGCFADIYHWKDGVGPKEERPTIKNIFWGGVIEDNSFGTHEFLNLCELLNTEPYLAVNVGTSTPAEAYEWIEYVTSDENIPMANLRRQNGREEPWKVKYWGIGNESWGCGGNMTANYYADLFKRFATYCWVDYRIASGGLPEDYEWTETLMKKIHGRTAHLISGLSFHHYTFAHNWQNKGSATDFDQEDWFLTVSKNMRMEEILNKHLKIMDKYDPDNKIALMADEWGNWHDVEPGTNPGFLFQQNTLRDAITASIYLNIFNNLCYRVKMANIAQTVNVLQAMVLTKEDQLVKTPTFYVFKMYKVHFDALMLPVEVACEKYTHGDDSVPALSVSASKNKDDEINITLANVHPTKDMQTSLLLKGLEKVKIRNCEIITSEKINSYNDFGMPEQVNIQEFSSVTSEKNSVSIHIPAKSIVKIGLNGQ
jgi:alpha-N-arabinofuranosidase